MNRALPPGNRGNRSSDSGWQSRPPGSVPGTRGLVSGVEDAAKRATPPGTSPAAREGQCRRDSGFERVGSFFALALYGRDRQAHFLANRSGQEPTDAVGLPGGRFHQFGKRGAVRPLQKLEDLRGLAPLPRARFLLGWFGRFRPFGGLLDWGALSSRLTLAGRNTGLAWCGVGLFSGVRLLGRGGLECLFFSIRRRHREFSLRGNHRGQDIDHSVRPRKQANTAESVKGDGTAMTPRDGR